MSSSALYPFVQNVRARVPPRTASFSGEHGPIAWLGLNSLGRIRRRAACESIKRSFIQSTKLGGCDLYLDVAWHPEGSPPIECPPRTAAKLSVLDIGSLHNNISSRTIKTKQQKEEEQEGDEGKKEAGEGGKEIEQEVPLDWEASCTRETDYYKAVTATVSNLSEKGYIPFTISDSPYSTVAALEGIRQVGHENTVLVHISQDTRTRGENDPVKRILERKLVKGVTQFGNHSLVAESRAIRKNYECRYADANALFDRGMFTLKDNRNQFPVYLSVDLEVLEPCFAPGVNNPESGGFSVRELIHLISVTRAPNIIGMDIVGYEPENDIYRKCGGDGMTSIVAAKLAKEMIVKAMTCSSKTRNEIDEYMKMKRLQGDAPAQYPDH